MKKNLKVEDEGRMSARRIKPLDEGNQNLNKKNPLEK
jgi:hypothetical protein